MTEEYRVPDSMVGLSEYMHMHCNKNPVLWFNGC